MSKFWSPIVSSLTPYIPGEQPKIASLIKLNTNENPYPPSPLAVAAIEKEINISGANLRLYPNPESAALKQAIAALHAQHSITPAHVFVGNGSDEVLAHAFQALFQHDDPILYPDISYSFYPTYCGLYRIAFKTIPLDENFNIRVDDYLNAGKNGGIIFPNPNAPTGCLLALTEVERLIAAQPDSVVIVDEAYIDFGGESAISLVTRYPNVLVVQTLSKSYSLAGLRVGFAVGDPALIEGLVRVKDSFNSYPVDRMAIAGATAAIQDQTYLEKTCAAVIHSRNHLIAGMQALGFEVLPSAANFIFARHPQHDAVNIAAGLRGDGILVRHFKMARINQFLRISIGTDAECQALLDALPQHLNLQK